jgi:ADP-heptose:LPS heptosyltransferase
MGDIVLTSPVVRCLKEQTGAEIHFLTKTSFAEICASSPYITRIWSFDKEPDQLFEALRQEQFDEVIDLHNNLRSLKVKWALGVRCHTFPKYRIAHFFLTRLGINLLPPSHIVERYMMAVEHLGVTYDQRGLDYFIPTDTTLSHSEVFGLSGYEVFAVGATHYTKRLPTERIIEICNARKTVVVLIGGDQELPAGRQIAESCGPKKVINLCGSLTLHQSALVVKDAQAVLTHDTGMMHIAAALRKPIYSFWGSTHHVLGFWPLYPAHMDKNISLATENLGCRPCTKFGRASCPKGHFKCMRNLDIHIVTDGSEHSFM